MGNLQPRVRQKSVALEIFVKIVFKISTFLLSSILFSIMSDRGDRSGSDDRVSF